MHSNFYDIEERINDLRDFESAIADSDVMENIWDGMENRLQAENSVYNLKNLEYAAPADVWAGIESQLISEPVVKPIWWWASGVAASLLLFLFGASQLLNVGGESKLNANRIENVEPTNVNGIDNIDRNSIETVNNSISDKTSENNSTPKSTETNETESLVANNRVTKNGVTILEKGNVLNRNNVPSAFVTSNSINSAAVQNTSNNVKNNKIQKAIVGSSTLLIASSKTIPSSVEPISIASYGDDEPTSLISNNTITPTASTIEALSVATSSTALANSASVVKADKTDVKDKTGDKNINLVTPRSIVIKKKEGEVKLVKDLIAIPTTPLKAQDIVEEEEVKSNNWKLYLSAGVGHIKPIKKHFEIIPVEENEPIIASYSKDKQKPGGGKAHIPEPIDDEEEELVKENAGLNLVQFSVPVSIALEGEYKITDKAAVRTGIAHTKLSYYYEKNKIGNKVDLKYLSVPLVGVVAIKDWKKIRLNGVVGGRVERMINSKYVLLEGREIFNDESFNSIENKGVNIAATLGFDLEYKLNNNSSIGIYPKMSKYISFDTQEIYQRDLEVVWPEINLGYSINF